MYQSIAIYLGEESVVLSSEEGSEIFIPRALSRHDWSIPLRNQFTSHCPITPIWNLVEAPAIATQYIYLPSS